MDNLGKNFWNNVGSMGLAAMACMFVGFISYLQEADFESWKMLFSTWAMGAIAGLLFYAGFNIKAILTERMPLREFAYSVAGILLVLLTMVLGKVAYAHAVTSLV